MEWQLVDLVFLFLGRSRCPWQQSLGRDPGLVEWEMFWLQLQKGRLLSLCTKKRSILFKMCFLHTQKNPIYWQEPSKGCKIEKTMAGGPHYKTVPTCWLLNGSVCSRWLQENYWSPGTLLLTGLREVTSLDRDRNRHRLLVQHWLLIHTQVKINNKDPSKYTVNKYWFQTTHTSILNLAFDVWVCNKYSLQ